MFDLFAIILIWRLIMQANHVFSLVIAAACLTIALAVYAIEYGHSNRNRR
jgi:hypothetical protein